MTETTLVSHSGTAIPKFHSTQAKSRNRREMLCASQINSSSEHLWECRVKVGSRPRSRRGCACFMQRTRASPWAFVSPWGGELSENPRRCKNKESCIQREAACLTGSCKSLWVDSLRSCQAPSLIACRCLKVQGCR